MHFNNSTNANTGQTQTPFKDITKNGKVRPWTSKKLANVTYAELLQILKYKKHYNVKQCGEILEFKPSDTGHLKLYKAWFCKSKLCPLCNWRRAMKHSYQTQRVVEEVLKEYPKSRWMFLTLTVKNVNNGHDLERSLTEMTKAFNKMIRYKKTSKNLIGYMRTTEVTVNKINGSYNQHMHVLLCVQPSYFRSSDNYIKQDEWTGFWKKALNVDYTPVVHIQAIKPNKKKDKAITSAVKETAKYSVKSNDYLTGDQADNLKAVYDLETGLYSKRLISYGGALREALRRLKLDDAENGDLIRTGEDDEESKIQEDANSIVAIFDYQKRDYYLNID